MAQKTWVQSQIESYQTLKKWYLMPQHYKVRIKSKVEHSRERSSAPLNLSVVAIKKGASGSPLTTVANWLSFYKDGLGSK